MHWQMGVLCLIFLHLIVVDQPTDVDVVQLLLTVLNETVVFLVVIVVVGVQAFNFKISYSKWFILII